MLHRNRTLGVTVNIEFGHRIYLTGVRPEVTVPELADFLRKYTEKSPTEIERVDLNTPRPAYIVTFSGLIDGEIQKFADRINGVYWHTQPISAHVI